MKSPGQAFHGSPRHSSHLQSIGRLSDQKRYRDIGLSQYLIELGLVTYEAIQGEYDDKTNKFIERIISYHPRFDLLHLHQLFERIGYEADNSSEISLASIEYKRLASSLSLQAPHGYLGLNENLIQLGGLVYMAIDNDMKNGEDTLRYVLAYLHPSARLHHIDILLGEVELYL